MSSDLTRPIRVSNYLKLSGLRKLDLLKLNDLSAGLVQSLEGSISEIVYEGCVTFHHYNTGAVRAIRID